MKKTILAIALGTILATFPGLASAISMDNFYFAANPLESGVNAARAEGQPGDLFGNGGVFNQITSFLLFIIGILSVVMIVIGGLKYVISGGNKDAVTSAKNTILYAIVGLIVALLAYSIINFVVGTFNTGFSGGTNV